MQISSNTATLITQKFKVQTLANSPFPHSTPAAYDPPSPFPHSSQRRTLPILPLSSCATSAPPAISLLDYRYTCEQRLFRTTIRKGILLGLSDTVGVLAGVLGQQPLVIYCNMFCSHLKGTSLLVNEKLAAKARTIRDSWGKTGARVVVESTSVFTNKDKVAAHLKSYQKELAAAKKAASLAARLCQKVQKSLLQSDVQSKLDKSPVTVADYGSQAVVSFVLERELSFEPFSLVAEEDSGDLRKDGARDSLERIRLLVNETIGSENTYSISPLSAEDVLVLIDNGRSEGGAVGRHWVLDPIDGTKGFLRGDQYAIALALLDQGKVVLGVLACPNLPLAPLGVQSSGSQTGCLFSAVIGNGTFMESLDGSSSPIKVTVSPTENSEEASFFESFEAAHSLHDLTRSIAKKLGVKAPPVRIDSQAKYGALSRGDGAIYLRFPHAGYREKIWDHAAGAIVVTEAGGVVTDAAGKPLDFSQGKYLDLYKGIVASNKKLMPAVLKAIQESIDEKPASL